MARVEKTPSHMSKVNGISILPIPKEVRMIKELRHPTVVQLA
jgi:hypothetical protein